jgi:ribonuclease HI
LKFAAGQGANNRAELSVLWLLLKTAVEKGLTKLQVFGDSKLMVNWANNQCRMDNLLLVPLMNQFLEVKEKFEDISFSHVFREFNSIADQLSKEALLLQEGLLYEQEFRGGTLISASEIDSLLKQGVFMVTVFSSEVLCF